jgi:DNA-binding response OmpR family regulator
MAYKVIVADSSPSVQRAAKMAFSNSEFKIYPFADGQEVLKHLSQIEPDVVLLRLSLPPENGYELACRIKTEEKFKGISIILFKGVFEEIDEKKMAELEYDELIPLPFDSDKLARLVQDLIGGRNDPQTLPEEIELDEILGLEIQTGLDEKVKSLVSKEFREAEREWVERIKDRLLPEIKSWLLKELEEQKKEKQEDTE